MEGSPCCEVPHHDIGLVRVVAGRAAGDRAVPLPQRKQVDRGLEPVFFATVRTPAGPSPIAVGETVISLTSPLYHC